ncbi:histidine-rich glycoprotein-like [Dermacentor silvarum]|uniref:histidine-rich glycoprotein-like n=1 Tax=Dermacentor silvarum TaxID=543639 RepID=UPI002100FC28|nr:histidine-rich glycoprotein-like [Dermacentor silvarum]
MNLPVAILLAALVGVVVSQDPGPETRGYPDHHHRHHGSPPHHRKGEWGPPSHYPYQDRPHYGSSGEQGSSFQHRFRYGGHNSGWTNEHGKQNRHGK